jgi:hypothetical protein
MKGGLSRQVDPLMKTYRLSQAYRDRAVRRTTLLSGGLLLPFVLAVPLIGGLLSGGDWTPVAFVLVVLPVPFLLGLWRGVGRRRRALDSYRVVLEGDEIIRVQEGLPDLVIRQEEVTEVVEPAGGGLLVHTADPDRVIPAPSGLEGYEELRALLGILKEISPRPPGPAGVALIPGLFPLAAVGGGLPVALFSDNRSAATFAALCAIGGFVWWFCQEQRSPHVDARTRLLSWLFVFAVLTLVVRLFQLWGG